MCFSINPADTLITNYDSVVDDDDDDYYKITILTHIYKYLSLLTD